MSYGRKTTYVYLRILTLLDHHIRWRTCVRSATHYFSNKISSLYVGREDGLETRGEVLEMVEELRESFEGIVKESKWMDKGSTVIKSWSLS